MAAELEEVLQNLLVPDNTVIAQATAKLRTIFKRSSAEVLPSLISVLGNSQNVQVRQYAAVLLRRRTVKKWQSFPPELQNMLKETLLHVLVKEPLQVVRHSAAQVVSTIAKHTLPANQWPELFTFIHQHIKSQQAAHREMGMFLLSSITDQVGEELRPHYPSLFQLFSTTIEYDTNTLVPFYTIRSLSSLILYVGTDEIPLVRPLIPKVVAVVAMLLTISEDKACSAMEIFDELVESEVAIVTPHVKLLVEFCLQIAGNANFGDNIRIKALHFISWLARLKPKAMMKNKLVEPTLAVVFPLMASVPNPEELDEDDDDEDDAPDGAEASRPCAVASQVVDVFALHLPPEVLIPPLMQLLQPALRSANPYDRKASLLALAVLAEGCADYIRNRYLQPALETVCQGLSDESHVVQNAALFALGQFSEHLQPDISLYCANVLPLLFEMLARSSETTKERASSVTRLYYALETFCENLGPGILPYLPALMDKLFVALSSSSSEHVKELAISAIGATANAAKEDILPFFPRIVELIKVYPRNPGSSGSNILQVQAIDTLGVLARTVGAENFMPLAKECVEMGLTLLDEDRDPDLRRCTYGLFASISAILRADMQTYLQEIVQHMMESLQSTEGVLTHYAGDDDPSFLLEDEDLEQADGGEDDDEVTGYSVENSYLEEKEDTCNALGEIAENTGAVFLRYLDEAFQEVLRLVQYPHVGTRKGAVSALSQFCCAFYRVLLESGDDQAPLHKMLSAVVPAYIAMINKDKDRTVVMATLEALIGILKSLRAAAVQGSDYVDGIAAAVKTVLLQKTACQEEEEATGDEEEQQAELDAMLVEIAGDVLPALAGATGGPPFAPYFAGFLPILLKKTRKSCPVSEKSFAIGTISEVVLAIGNATLPFVQHLLPVFMMSIRDADDEVRSNATYGIGLLAFHGGDVVLPHFPSMLDALYGMAVAGQPPRVMDNICGALSRMAMANRAAVPLEKVFPFLVQCLPLKEDMEENPTVYSCIMELYSDRHPLVMQHLPQLLAIFASVLPSADLQEGVCAGLVNMTRSVHQEYPQEFQNVVSGLSQEFAQVLMSVLGTNSPD